MSTNGAFTFISEMLPKGTKTKSAQEIALAVANMAGTLNGFSGKNTFGVKADFLSRFLEDGLSLVGDVLRNPVFDPEEANKVRMELLSRLKQQEDSLTGFAFREFNRLLFGGHPYGLNTAGSEEVIRSLTTSALREIYDLHSRPDQLVLAISGAVDAEKVRLLASDLFEDWKNFRQSADSGIEEALLPPEAIQSPKILNISRDKEQVHLVIGFLGTTLDSRDRFSLEVLDTVLSGQSGRLFSELRDRQSLAYSLSSFSLLGLDTGAFGIYIGTSPDKREQAIREIWKQLQRIRDELVTEEELSRAKNILISQYEMGLQTHASQALEIALNETYNLGQDFGNRYIDEINRVTADDVLTTARKYILPEQHVMVSVGAGLKNESEKAVIKGEAQADKNKEEAVHSPKTGD